MRRGSFSFLKSRVWITRETSGKSVRDDDGQLAILVIGFVVVALALVSVVTAATNVHLARARLAAVADLAALDAADAIGQADYYRADGDATLSDEAVAAAVDAYLREHPDPGAGAGVRVIEAASPDGRTVSVTLRSVARPTLVAWLPGSLGDGFTLEASSSARAW